MIAQNAMQVQHNPNDESATFREAKGTLGISFGQMLYFDGAHTGSDCIRSGAFRSMLQFAC